MTTENFSEHILLFSSDTTNFFVVHLMMQIRVNTIQLLTVDLLALALMKGIASCDK